VSWKDKNRTTSDTNLAVIPILSRQQWNIIIIIKYIPCMRTSRVNENTVFMTFRLQRSLFRGRVGRWTLFFFSNRRRAQATRRGRGGNNVIIIMLYLLNLNSLRTSDGRTDGCRMCACDPTGPRWRRRQRRFLFRSRPWPKGLAPTTTRPPRTMGLSILV